LAPGTTGAITTDGAAIASVALVADAMFPAVADPDLQGEEALRPIAAILNPEAERRHVAATQQHPVLEAERRHMAATQHPVLEAHRVAAAHHEAVADRAAAAIIAKSGSR
jgi:hypothetical protein